MIPLGGEGARALPPGLRRAGTLQGPGSRAVHTAWSPDGELIAACFADGSILVWRDPARDPVATMRAAAGAIEHLAWSPDGGTLAAGRRGPILRWRLEPGQADTAHAKAEALPPLQIGAGTVSALAWSSAGEAFSVAVRETLPEGLERLSLRRYRVSDAALEERLERTEWDGAWLAVSANRRLVALSLPSAEVELWDLGCLVQVCRLSVEYRRLHAVALSPDRHTLALSYGDGSVWLWSTLTGERLQVLQVHEAPAYSLEFSYDQSLLASRSLDRTVRFRLCSNWRKGACLQEPSATFQSDIAFHPGRLRLATYGDLNTTLRLWDLDSETLGFFDGDTTIPVLFLAANPIATMLHLDEELREIQDHLAFAKLRDRFTLSVRMAVKPDDFIRFLTEDHPQIVHFSGHGIKSGAIITQDVSGQMTPIGAKVLEALFSLVVADVQCVILNACYATFQARAIARHIPFVIGMSTSISDAAAIAYSRGFYQAVGGGQPIERAHEFGKAQILLLGLKERDTPVLIRRDEILAEEAVLQHGILHRLSDPQTPLSQESEEDVSTPPNTRPG